MTYFLFGFMFGMFVTLIGAMLLPRRRRISPGKGGIGRGSAPLRRPGPYSNHPRGLLAPPPKMGCARWFINNPAIIAECGGPCTAGHSHCDCGALWIDVPTTNQPPGCTP